MSGGVPLWSHWSLKVKLWLRHNLEAPWVDNVSDKQCGAVQRVAVSVLKKDSCPFSWLPIFQFQAALPLSSTVPSQAHQLPSDESNHWYWWVRNVAKDHAPYSHDMMHLLLRRIIHFWGLCVAHWSRWSEECVEEPWNCRRDWWNQVPQ